MAESERSKVSLRSASEKRSRGSPTGCTPLQKGKRSTTELKEVGESQQTGSHHCQPRRRRLAFAKTDAWSDSEQIAIVEFILLHKPGTNNEVVQRGWSCLCHSWLAVGGVFKLVPHSA